jgi:hypothetical protein
VDPYAILFFPGKCFQITPFGMSFAHALSRDDASYLIAFPDLDEKFLRQAFTGFELVLYKICHIVLEDQRTDYHWETQKTRQRFRRIRTLLSMEDWTSFERLFDNVFFLRDAFAHSFIQLDEIKYDGVPLSDCFWGLLSWAYKARWRNSWRKDIYGRSYKIVRANHEAFL